jgi:hypothetical protein
MACIRAIVLVFRDQIESCDPIVSKNDLEAWLLDMERALIHASKGNN